MVFVNALILWDLLASGCRMRSPNNSIEPTEASGSAPLHFTAQWRLASAAHAERWPSSLKLIML